MLVTLEKVKEDGRVTLNHLVELASYDLSEYNGRDVHENGLFVADFDSKSWLDSEHFHLFFIRADEKIAGFVVIRNLYKEQVINLNHFFVLRKYRRQGVGREAAIQAFNLFKGRWRVNQYDWNVPAQHFWRSVIQAYANQNYTETIREDIKGPSQEFSNHEM